MVDSVTGFGQIQLNGRALGTIDGSFRFDVTDLLEERNRLEIDLSAESDAGGVTGEVALEIAK